MYSDFDFEILNSPEFKEDSVREEIIVPLLKRLGYRSSGANRIIRSKTLTHPFIYVGTRKHPAKTIPDYTLFHEDKPILILDAKSPTEDILKPSHIQQAYSYAIHPEIKCKNFALCNGHKLVIFDTDHSDPLLLISAKEFNDHWDEIEKYLSPRFLMRPELRRFAPDFGFKLHQIGITKDIQLIMPGVQLNLFGKVTEELYTAGANCDFTDEPHCVSFDFNSSLLPAILKGIPQPIAEQFSNALFRAPFQAAAELAIELDIAVHLGEKTQGRDEEFIPLIIEKVMESRFNFEPLDNPSNDIPPHVYRLRNSFKIKG